MQADHTGLTVTSLEGLLRFKMGVMGFPVVTKAMIRTLSSTAHFGRHENYRANDNSDILLNNKMIERWRDAGGAPFP